MAHNRLHAEAKPAPGRAPVSLNVKFSSKQENTHGKD
jgi:hypothetical protein